MSHHYSGPDVSFPRGDARLDLTDVFAFPGGIGKSILIMNVHPSSSINPVGPTIADPFAPDALYEFKIDTDGDAIADIAYRIRFSPFAGGVQKATLRRVDGKLATETGDSGLVIIENAPVSVGREARITEASGHRFFAGWRSDPFFFDPLGALKGFQFTGHDFFLDKDVCSIALEVPNSALGSNVVGLWARTLDGTDGNWIQADRGARPSQSIFLPGDEREAYLAGEPADDVRFVAAFAHSLQHTGGYSSDDARSVAQSLLPDIMRFDPMRAASYPENGRTLTDDVMDDFLKLLTNGRVRTDQLAAHRDFLAEFPFLGPPHSVRVGIDPTKD